MRLFGKGRDDGKGSMFNIEKRTNLPTLIIIALVIVFFLVFSFVSSLPTCGGLGTKKEPLPADKCTKLDIWYDSVTPYSDSSIVGSMDTFYKTTGVQPFLIVATGLEDYQDADLAKMAEDYYKNNLFEGTEPDQGHMVIAFYPKMQSLSVGYYVGSDAQTVIDDYALDTFTSTLTSCYNQNTLSGTKVIKNTFKKAAKSIMGKGEITMYILTAVLAICFIYFGVNLIRNRKKEESQSQG